MGKKSKLLFGIHMHQPVDNFDWVIEKGVELCYGPFFDVMSRYPEFKFSVHCSGWLMEQIKQKHPKLYAQIKSLAKQGSIEFFSAGYYEPILSAIPSQDRVAQIGLLNKSIKKEFKQTPKGLWLTERVWESALIPDLTASGIKYTVMDDYHFQCAGFDEDVLDGYYMSEEGGHNIGLFPISKKLRYALPFLNVQNAIDAIKSYNKEESSAAIIYDDAEKFGMWPGTFEWVYEKKWLENFVEAVLLDETIQTLHYDEYFETCKPKGIAYLPNVSYYEMGEWSLRADDALQLQEFKDEMGFERYEKEGVKFLKGGIWKNFLVKYEESNRIHKRALELSKIQESVKGKKFKTSLYKSQTNDALWHGVFGGLYLPNLRDNAYRYIIESERHRYKKSTAFSIDDNELSGYEKFKAYTGEYIFRFDAAFGGQLVEFDTVADEFNWQNTLTRRKEAYHKLILEDKEVEERPVQTDGIDTIHHAQIKVDDELKNSLIYDWYLKNSFIDHISDERFNADNFRYCNFREFGDFANQPFEMNHSKNRVTFSREGGIYIPQKVPTRVEKSFEIVQNGFDFSIKLETESEQVFNYVLEHNFHFSDYEMVSVNGVPLEEEGCIDTTDKLEIIDTFLNKKIIITLSKSCKLYYFQLKTLSQSEEGFDLSVQGVSFAMVFAFTQNLDIEGKLEIVDV